MLQSRGLILAVLLLAALGGGIWYSEKLEKEKEGKPPADASPKLVEIAEDQFKKVEIGRRDGESTVLERGADGKWAMTAPQKMGVDSDTVATMVQTLSNYGTDKLVEEKPSDLASFGLSSPSLTVTVTRKDGKSHRLLFGDDTPTGGGFYAKLDGDPRVFTIYSYNRSSIDKTWKDLRDKRLLRFDNDKVTRVELTAKKQSLEFGKNAAGEWQILKPGPYRGDNLQIEEIVRKLREARMEVAADEDAAKNASAFTAGTVVAVAKVTDASGTQQIEVRKNVGDYFARSSAVEGVYKVGKDLGEGLDKDLDELRNKKLFDFGFNDPSKVDIRDGANSSSVLKAGDGWTRDGKKLDAPSVQALIDKLRDLSAIKFLTAGYANPVLDLSVVSTDGKRTEKVGVAKSGNSWIAKREGEPARYELDGRAVEELQQAVAGLKEAAPAAKK